MDWRGPLKKQYKEVTCPTSIAGQLIKDVRQPLEFSLNEGIAKGGGALGRDGGNQASKALSKATSRLKAIPLIWGG